jgi:peptidyl-prolyl cis-trans isomerase-like protein 2
MQNMLATLVPIPPPLVTKRSYISHLPTLLLHSCTLCSKSQAPHPGTRTPFDSCALSFQPFTHPMCARNSDGTGHVFDLVNIIPWLKCARVFIPSIPPTEQPHITRQHNNTHPITKKPLSPSDLITLHYSRKEASGELHDPISFKPFSEHSHIVAIAITGNVFLADSIKGGKDLVSEVPFKKCI